MCLSESQLEQTSPLKRSRLISVFTEQTAAQVFNDPLISRRFIADEPPHSPPWWQIQTRPAADAQLNSPLPTLMETNGRVGERQKAWHIFVRLNVLKFVSAVSLLCSCWPEGRDLLLPHQEVWMVGFSSFSDLRPCSYVTWRHQNLRSNSLAAPAAS